MVAMVAIADLIVSKKRIEVKKAPSFKMGNRYTFDTGDCPTCKSKMQSCSAVRKINEDEEPPKEGAIMVCGLCGELLTLDKNLKRILITDALVQEIKFRDPQTWELIEKVIEYSKEHGKGKGYLDKVIKDAFGKEW